jgi:hypothetical protein
VFLRVFEQEVSAVEDPDLLDVSLGGPDTSQRIRLMVQLHRIPLSATDPATALAAATGAFAGQGLRLDTTTMELFQHIQLKVGLPATAVSSSPCDPIDQGGYLGPDNQLIRIQIAVDPATKTPQLLWSYDNASFLYRAAALVSQGGTPTTPGPTTLQLVQYPVDAYHVPQSGQIVEVLRAAATLGIEADTTDPIGKRIIVRCVAEQTGFLTSVSAYNRINNTVTLNTTLPPGYGNPLFLRVWQGQNPIVLANLAQPIALLDSVTGLPLGLQVTLSLPQDSPAGASLPVGAFWTFAVRPSTPQAVYPEQFLTDPQWPDGPRSWIGPLALINWLAQGSFSSPSFSGPAVPTDCRNRFANLVELTNRTWGDQVNVSGVSTQGSSVNVLSNGATLTLSELEQGLQISLNQNVVAASATPGSCFVTLGLPYPIPGTNSAIGSQPIVLDANVTSPSPSTITWLPSFAATSGLEAFFHGGAGQNLGDFAKDWTSITPAALPASIQWSYTGTGHALLEGTVQLPISNSQTVVVKQAQTVQAGVTGLRAVASSSLAPGMGTGEVSFGIVFNEIKTNNYWVFGFTSFPARAGSALAFLSHFKPNNQVMTTSKSVTVASSVQEITLEIHQLPGSIALSFYITILGTPILLDFTLPPEEPPPFPLGINSNVGLSINLQGSSGTPNYSIEVSEMTIEYGANSQALLPANFLLPLNLVVKRSFLQPAPLAGAASQPANSSPAPCPDYSLGLWLIPPSVSGELAHGSIPSASKP